MRAKEWKYKRCLVSMLFAIEPTFLCPILHDIYTDTTNFIGTRQLLSRTVQQTVGILIKTRGSQEPESLTLIFLVKSLINDYFGFSIYLNVL